MFMHVLVCEQFFLSVRTETLLSRYLNSHGFSELYLDSMFKYGDDNRLPREVKTDYLKQGIDY